MRTHDPEMRQQAKDLMEQIVNGICEGYGCDCTVNYRFGLPVTFNNIDLAEWAVDILNNRFGTERVVRSEPAMGAEDFSFYAEKIPAFFYRLGGGNEEKGYTWPGHNPHFSVDEDAIVLGVESMVTLVLEFLSSDERFSTN